MTRWQRILLASATVLLLLVLGVAVVTWQINRPLTLDEPAVVTLEPGSSLQRFAHRLAENDWIISPWVLTLPVRWQGDSRRIQAGEYRLQPGMRPADVIEMLISGRTVQYPITLIEGQRIQDVLDALWHNEIIENTLEGLPEDQIARTLSLPWPALEGAFFPDTYHVTRGTTDRELLARAEQRLQQVLDEEWPDRAVALPYESRYDALIMASIIEKESAHRPEMPRIAGVFVRRLQQGMRLQSDPTVIYGMGEAYEGDIRRQDLRNQTPWNTYRVDGLPPTPIALSGREAIRAALQPAQEPYLYFVSRGDGTHEFSETLEQHNAAVQRYILGETPGETEQ